MGGCAAINYSNHSGNGFKLFNFTKDLERRKKSTLNCWRYNWEAGPGAHFCESPPEPDFDSALHQRIAALEAENKLLKEQLETKDTSLSLFMSSERISMLGKEKKCIPRWSDDTVMKGLKLQFVFGKHGYEHCFSIGYPMSSYSTLNRLTEGISVD